MSLDKDHSRESIRRLIEAAYNPVLSDEQADALMNEAMENSNIAFGADSDCEFSNLIFHFIKSLIEDQTLRVERQSDYC